MARLTTHAFDARWGLDGEAETRSPIFLLAAGWRTGSTLLQRLVCSSGEVLVWGEPYGRTGLVPALARSARPLGADWPGPGHFGAPEVYADLASHWIANLYPPPEALRGAFANCLDTWLAAPAAERDFERFGLKEVRLEAADARFLEWIYPRARFVFLTRNPWDAWASARGGRWVAGPDRTVTTARDFAEHWRRLALGFTDWPEENGCLIRYEDLRDPAFDLELLREHCRLGSIHGRARQRVLRGLQRPPQPLPAAEVELVRLVCGDVAERMGYRGPRETEATPGRTDPVR